MTERLTRAAWPPLVALLAGVGVFCGVLLATPPGFAAIREAFLPANDPRVLPAAYALGAASFLAFATLGLVAPILALLSVALEWLRAPRPGEPPP